MTDRLDPLKFRICGVALAAAVALSPAIARADDGKADAEVLFEEGRKAMVARDYSVACAKFVESIKLSPGIGATLWLADCYERAGKTASAWAEFKAAEQTAALHGDNRGKLAARRAAELEPKLSYLTVVVEHPVDGLVVRRDETEVGSATRGIAVPVDPGSHLIVAAAPHHVDFTTKVDVAANGARAQVRIPALERSVETAAPVASPRADTSSGQTQRVLGIAAASFGVVSLGVGSWAGLSAQSKNDASNEGGHCGPGNACDAEGLRLRDQAVDRATLATVAFSVGVVALIGGAVLYFTAPRGPAPAAARGVLRF